MDELSDDQSDEEASRRSYGRLVAWATRLSRIPEPTRPPERPRVALPSRVIEPVRSPDPARC